jgi:hypothetical protein
MIDFNMFLPTIQNATQDITDPATGFKGIPVSPRSIEYYSSDETAFFNDMVKITFFAAVNGTDQTLAANKIGTAINDMLKDSCYSLKTANISITNTTQYNTRKNKVCYIKSETTLTLHIKMN